MNRCPNYKLVLIGDSGVGKTSLFVRVKDNVFGNEVTRGIESCETFVHVDGVRIKLQLWDTAGVERFRTLTRNYYRNAHCTLLTCAFNERSSLNSLQRWSQDADFYCRDGLKVIVANKNDLERQLSREQLQNFASTFGCRMVSSVSAKTGDGVAEMLQEVGRLLLLHMHAWARPRDSVISNENSQVVDLRRKSQLQQQQQQQQQLDSEQQQQQACCSRIV